jgi:hypothetical protein
MRKEDIINHFGTLSKVARALDITQGAITQWHDIIPEKQAMRLERITHRALVYDEGLYHRPLITTPKG